MNGSTNRKLSPASHPELYRPATLNDIIDSTVRYFYTSDGACWRKNGAPQAFKRNIHSARVPVKFGMYSYDYVDESVLYRLYVQL